MKECEEQPVLMQQTGQKSSNNNKLLPAKAKTTSQGTAFHLVNLK